LCAPLGVINSSSGRVEVTTLKFPLVPITQPRAWNARPTATSWAGRDLGIG
jgi:hypothetical protein